MEAIFWTKHAREKMKFYRLSEQRLKILLRRPDRIERGVAPRTCAIMQKSKSKRPSEIWLMYQKKKFKREKLGPQAQIKIISAWRYPGHSPKGLPPIPEDILKQVLEEV